MAHLGRALFGTRYDNGSIKIRREIVTFAQAKLLGNSHVYGKLHWDGKLACLAVRLCVEFRASDWAQQEPERRQVERHMCICLFATAAFNAMVTISPSEPLLAEGAYKAMAGWSAAEALLQHIDGSSLSAGDRGELIAVLIVLLARDDVVRSQAPSGVLNDRGLKTDGMPSSRVVTVVQFLRALFTKQEQTNWALQPPAVCQDPQEKTVPLEKAFENGYIWFNHFIRAEDYNVINQEYLWRLISRGAAVICANNQRAIDILIPVLFGQVLLKEKVSAILIQVKNDQSFKTTMRHDIFDGMCPFHIGLFAKGAAPQPIIRMVFALASKGSAVKHLDVSDMPRFKKAKFTAYDIWCAGTTPDTFGVIEPQEVDTYRALLLRSRKFFDHYTASTGGTALDKRRIEARRQLNPGCIDAGGTPCELPGGILCPSFP